MNILITSASRKVSLVVAFQQALAQEGGGKVVAVDTSEFAPALYLADERYLVPPSNTPEFLGVILRLCERQAIKLLVPTRDGELLFFAEHKERISQIGTVVMVSDPSCVRICQNKGLFLRFCEEHGFAVPKTYGRPNALAPVAFPLFVKPRYAVRGRQTMRVSGKEELELALLRIPDAIIQECIVAPEYSIDLFSDFSGRVISVVPRERIYMFGGESFVARTSRNQVLIKEATRLASNLGLIGHNTIQCFLDGDVVKFIEVNPRFGGGANLGFAAGANTPAFLVKIVKGKPVEPRIGQFKDNYVMLRYTEDMCLHAEAVTTRTYR